jgi:acyl dehydratase
LEFPSAVGPGDEITATSEVVEVREDKPMFRLATTIANQDGVMVLECSALVWQEPLD